MTAWNLKLPLKPWPYEVLLQVLFAILTPAWTEQIRWTSYEGHTRPVPLKSRATPQGCPIAPMVLAIWASAFCLHGWQMTMHCKQLHGISDAIEAWNHWSERMGLRESPEKKKIQVCGKTKFPKPVAGGLQTGPLGRLQKNDLAPLFTAFRRGSLHPAIWRTSFWGRSLIAKSHTSDQDLGVISQASRAKWFSTMGKQSSHYHCFAVTTQKKLDLLKRSQPLCLASS